MEGMLRAAGDPAAADRPQMLMVRGLLIVGLLAGLLLMHGLSAEHRLPMPHQTRAAGAAHSLTAYAGTTRVAHSDSWVGLPTATSQSHQMGMGPACVAVLTAVGLAALILPRPVGAGRPSRTPTASPAAGRSSARGPSPPRQPDLAVLCVLRT